MLISLATELRPPFAEPRTGPISVLVADDNAIYRVGFTRAVARDPRFELIGEVADGDSALESIEELRPDVALLDLTMPGLTALRIAQALEDRGGAGDTCLIMVTSLLEPAVVSRAHALGFAAAMSKDLTRRQILDAVVRVVDPDLTSAS